MYSIARSIHSSSGMFVNKLSTSKETIKKLISFGGKLVDFLNKRKRVTSVVLSWDMRI